MASCWHTQGGQRGDGYGEGRSDRAEATLIALPKNSWGFRKRKQQVDLPQSNTKAAYSRFLLYTRYAIHDGHVLSASDHPTSLVVVVQAWSQGGVAEPLVIAPRPLWLV
jgi:hypothetical protein